MSGINKLHLIHTLYHTTPTNALILSNRQFINPIHNSNMFQHLKVNLQGIQLVYSPRYQCINITPWRWPFKCRNMLELRIVLTKWWFSNLWLHLSALFWYSPVLSFHTVLVGQTKRAKPNSLQIKALFFWKSGALENYFRFSCFKSYKCSLITTCTKCRDFGVDHDGTYTNHQDSKGEVGLRTYNNKQTN